MTAIVFTQDNGELRECCDCREQAASRAVKTQTFEYAARNGTVVLTVDVPVWTCTQCGAETTDGEAEDVRHGAICDFLKVLKPIEIRELRKELELTQAALASLTGFGEASIKRWESGGLIQNDSADRLLRVLRFETGRRLVEEIARAKQGGNSVHR